MIWFIYSFDIFSDEVVWICFVCAKSFPDQALLMEHQTVCEEDTFINLENVGDDNKLVSNMAEDTKQVSCDAENITQMSHKDDSIKEPSSLVAESKQMSHRTASSEQMSNVADNIKHDSIVNTGYNVLKSILSTDSSNNSQNMPVPTLLRKVGSSIKSLPLGLPTLRGLLQQKQQKRRKFKDIYIPPPRDVYFESLGLMHTPQAEALSVSPRKSVKEEDCKIIDLTVDSPPQCPAMPVTPRTKSLMTQLSQDESMRKRQLSFSKSLPDNALNTEIKTESQESQSSDSEEDESRKVKKVLSKSAILGIPLTSPLGQRLKGHWNSEQKIPVISEVERYCRTNFDPAQTDEVPKPKNAIVEKLRIRPPPPVTFRFSKKYMNKWFHLYKFNKADKHEFQKRLRTGLDRESRLRLKRMKPCKIVLHRISEKDINYWRNPRPKFVQSKPFKERQYPVYYTVGSSQGPRPSLFSNRRYTPPMLRHPVTPRPQFVQHIGDGRPTPQLLVRTIPIDGEKMHVQIMPVQGSNTSFFPTTSLVSHSQKRKQVFTGLKEDDMVICLSSDEEDDKDLSSKIKSKCSMCIFKKSCPVHDRAKMEQTSSSNSINNSEGASHSSQCTAGLMDSASFSKSQTCSMCIYLKECPVHSGKIKKIGKQTEGISKTVANALKEKIGKSGPYDAINRPATKKLGTNIEPVNVIGNSFHPTNSDSYIKNSQHSNLSKEYCHLQISNGKILSANDASHSSQCTSSTTDKNSAETVAEDDIDYEVICIDSDEES